MLFAVILMSNFHFMQSFVILHVPVLYDHGFRIFQDMDTCHCKCLETLCKLFAHFPEMLILYLIPHHQSSNKSVNLHSFCCITGQFIFKRFSFKKMKKIIIQCFIKKINLIVFLILIPCLCY